MDQKQADQKNWQGSDIVKKEEEEDDWQLFLEMSSNEEVHFLKQYVDYLDYLSFGLP